MNEIKSVISKQMNICRTNIDTMIEELYKYTNKVGEIMIFYKRVLVKTKYK